MYTKTLAVWLGKQVISRPIFPEKTCNLEQYLQWLNSSVPVSSLYGVCGMRRGLGLTLTPTLCLWDTVTVLSVI